MIGARRGRTRPSPSSIDYRWALRRDQLPSRISAIASVWQSSGVGVGSLSSLVAVGPSVAHARAHARARPSRRAHIAQRHHCACLLCYALEVRWVRPPVFSTERCRASPPTHQRAQPRCLPNGCLMDPCLPDPHTPAPRRHDSASRTELPALLLRHCPAPPRSFSRASSAAILAWICSSLS